MNSDTTLTIPPDLYERARRVAQEQQRDVADVVADVLEMGLPPLEDPDAAQHRRREIEAFHRLHATLRQQHPDEYVAIYQEAVVDHDPEMAALLQRINASYPDSFVLIRQVRTEPEIVYQHRSIRWA